MEREKLRAACDGDAALMRIRARILQPWPERSYKPNRRYDRHRAPPSVSPFDA
jgi:hypothetical protein